MRDPNRIIPILEKLKEYWLKYPDLRLCQIIVNIAGDNPFYIEDYVFGDRLDRELEKQVQYIEPEEDLRDPKFQFGLEKKGGPYDHLKIQKKY